MMLKEQNVISNILIFLTIITSNNIHCQKKLTGKYTNLIPQQEYYNYYVFYKNGLFDYHSGASLGDDKYGNGNYYINNNKIFLNYNLTTLQYSSFHKPSIWIDANDSITVNISVKNFKKKSISYCNIRENKNHFGVEADKKGNGVLRFQKENENTKINISFIGYKKYTLIINQNYNYNIEVFLERSGKGIPIKNQLDTLNVVDFNSNSFTVKNKKGKVILWKKYKP